MIKFLTSLAGKAVSFIPGIGAAKIAFYIAVAAAVFGGGFYCGRRWELPAVTTAQLATAQQQQVNTTANADAAIAANKAVAANQALGDAALVARQGQQAVLASSVASDAASIATAAATPGEDGALPPVLLNLNAEILQAQGGQK